MCIPMFLHTYTYQHALNNIKHNQVLNNDFHTEILAPPCLYNDPENRIQKYRES